MSLRSTVIVCCALAGGCQSTVPLSLAPLATGCAFDGPIEQLVVGTQGDLPPIALPSLTLRPDELGRLPALHQRVRVITVEGLAAGGRRVAIGRTAPFELTSRPGTLAVAYGPVDRPCVVAAMAVPRADHLATLLPSGYVLLSGGRGEAGPVAALEVYDPTAARFVRGGDLKADAVLGHTLSPLDNGTLLLTGGAGGDGPALARAETISLDGRQAHGAGTMASPRAFHTATTLPSGTILIVGGCAALQGDDCAPGARVKSTEIFDPRQRLFVAGPTLNRPRSHHQAIPRSDGTILIVGGRVDGGPATEAEVLEPMLARVLPTGGVVGGAAALDSGALVVAGGERQAEKRLAVLVEATAKALPELPQARQRPTVSAFEDGDVLILGGRTAGGQASGAAELVSAGEVRTLPAVSPREGHTVTRLFDGTLLIVGGRGTGGRARGDGELWVHSLRGPFAALEPLLFDGPGLGVVPRRPDRARRVQGQLVITGEAMGEPGLPTELVLLPAASYVSVDIALAAGRGAGGRGVAVILGWRGDADYAFLHLEPGQPVRLMHVGSQEVGKRVVAADGRCSGEILAEGELPTDGLGKLLVVSQVPKVQVVAGERLILDCAATNPVERGQVGLGTLGGEARFDDVTATRR